MPKERKNNKGKGNDTKEKRKGKTKDGRGKSKGDKKGETGVTRRRMKTSTRVPLIVPKYISLFQKKKNLLFSQKIIWTE